MKNKNWPHDEEFPEIEREEDEDDERYHERLLALEQENEDRLAEYMIDAMEEDVYYD